MAAKSIELLAKQNFVIDFCHTDGTAHRKSRNILAGEIYRTARTEQKSLNCFNSSNAQCQDFDSFMFFLSGSKRDSCSNFSMTGWRKWNFPNEFWRWAGWMDRDFHTMVETQGAIRGLSLAVFHLASNSRATAKTLDAKRLPDAGISLSTEIGPLKTWRWHLLLSIPDAFVPSQGVKSDIDFGQIL
jgi:hypothetical protein